MNKFFLFLGFAMLLLLSSCNWFTNEDPPDVYTGGTVTSVTFELLSPTHVKLNWVENFPDETGFYVDRKLWDGAWQRKILHVGANVTTATDSTAELGKVYYYKIYAHRGEDESVEEEQQYNCFLPCPYNVDYDYSWSFPNRLRLFWTNQATWADSIVVAKRISGEEWTPHVAVLPGDATEYTDYTYNVNQITSWGFTAYYQEHVSQQHTITMMPPK